MEQERLSFLSMLLSIHWPPLGELPYDRALELFMKIRKSALSQAAYFVSEANIQCPLKIVGQVGIMYD